MYGELASRNPKHRDVWLSGQRRGPGPLNPRPPGQATWGPPTWTRRDSPALHGPGCPRSLPSDPEGKDGGHGWATGHARNTPSSAFAQANKRAPCFCVKCQPLESAPSCSQGRVGRGWAGPEVDLQKGTWHCALGFSFGQGPCPPCPGVGGGSCRSSPSH